MNIAIVDDNPKDSARIKKYVDAYFEEHKEDHQTFIYRNGLDFLDDLKKNFDIVFMDIEMPYLDGITAARKMREIDEATVLVFITNMAQYAIHGYEVNAIDFMVKPVGYYNFSDKLAKALRFVKRNTEKILLLKCDKMLAKIPVSDIYYLEKDKNYIVFHTKTGEYRERGSMNEMEEKLSGDGFSKCLTGCMVNLRHVSKISKESVWVRDTCLPVSRMQKKQLVKDFADFWGGEPI